MGYFSLGETIDRLPLFCGGGWSLPEVKVGLRHRNTCHLLYLFFSAFCPTGCWDVILVYFFLYFPKSEESLQDLNHFTN